MDKTQKSLLAILSSIIHGKGFESVGVDETCQWQELYKVSAEQAVSAVVFCEIQRQYNNSQFSTLNSELKLQWYALQQQLEKKNTEALRVIYKVIGELEQKGIKAILLKGQGLARYYPNPLARNVGDIDLYVGADNYEAAKKLMAEKGWMDGDGLHEDLKHLKISVDGVLIELHKYPTILPGIKRNEYFQKWMGKTLACPLEGFFVNEDGVAGVNRGVFVSMLPPAENLVFMFIHAFYHFISEGLVARHLMDIALLLKAFMSKHSVAAAEQILGRPLRRTGFMKVWQVFGCVMVEHLGFAPEDIPFYNKRYNRKATNVVEAMFREGRKNAEADRKGKHSGIVWYLGICKRYLSHFWLFPKESVEFLSRLVMNTTMKYARL